MKKLNITKEQFNKSRYFQKKYGKLEYVSESGNLFKTNKGKVLKFKESSGIADTYDEFDALADELEAKYKKCEYVETELYVDDEGSYTIEVRIDTEHKDESKEINRFLVQQCKKHHWRLEKEADIYDPVMERRVDVFNLYVF